MFLYFVMILEQTAIVSVYSIKWMYTVAQLFEALHYKPEGRGFVFKLCHSKLTFLPYYDTGFDVASNRNEYQVYLLGAKAADS
jgi:hypothetical protein